MWRNCSKWVCKVMRASQRVGISASKNHCLLSHHHYHTPHSHPQNALHQGQRGKIQGDLPGRYLGWVDLDVSYSIVHKTLLELMRILLRSWSGMMKLTNESQPNPVSDLTSHPVHWSFACMYCARGCMRLAPWYATTADVTGDTCVNLEMPLGCHKVRLRQRVLCKYVILSFGGFLGTKKCICRLHIAGNLA